MPQIWLTYEELGEFCGCSTDEARMQVIEQQLPRRRSRDGQTRVKLPEALMRDFIRFIAAQWQGVHAAAEIEMARTFALTHEQAPGFGLQPSQQDSIADQTSGYLRAFLPARPLARRA